MRRILAAAAGAGAAVIVTVASAAGILRGPGAWILLLLAVLAVPTSSSLSRRIAVNFLILIGIVPILWWLPWQIDGSGRAGAICGVVVGAVLCLLLWSPVSRAAVIPRWCLTDLIVAALAPVSAAIYAPFFITQQGAGAVAMLTRGTGGDNLSHFDIFEMIRRTGLALSWSAPAGVDSNYALASYPQHFHTLAVFGAELWGGSGVGTVDREAGLYGVGLVFALSMGMVAVVAGLVSLPSLRRRPILAMIAATVIVSSIMLGLGATLLSYGFPNFLLGVCVTATVLLLIGSPRPMNVTVLVAVSAAVITVAHTWSLLAPLVGLGLLIAMARLPWRSYRGRWSWAIVPTVVAAATAASCLYAVVLVFRATGGVAASSGALEVPGDIPPNPLLLTLACVLAVAATGTWLLRRSRGRGFRGVAWTLGLAASLFAVAGLVMSVALIDLQLQHRPQLGYYQYKFLDAVLLVSVVLGVAVVTFLVPRTTRLTDRIRPAFRVVLGGGISLIVILLAGVPVATSGPTSGFAIPAALYRDGLNTSRQTYVLPAEDLTAAATVMATHPCFRPIFIADFRPDLPLDLENTRAMALSGTWTQDTQEIDLVLRAARTTTTQQPRLGHLVESLLDDHPERCVVISPTARGTLSADARQRFEGRLLSWDAAG